MKTLIPSVLLLFILFQINLSHCSVGDNSYIYKSCVSKCTKDNCGGENQNIFIKNYDQVPAYLKLLQWTCKEECQHQCMWQTVDVFKQKGLGIPQFHGKWPFIRFYGIQEPASVIFSLFNFIAHGIGIYKFRKEVPLDAPLYRLWNFYAMVCLNAWIWSMVFHTRDKTLTELLDYAFAFSIVLVSCYCMVARLLHNVLGRSMHFVQTFFVSIFLNHVLYLWTNKFDYAYNMRINVFLGTITAVGWFIWAALKRSLLPYTWKCALFVTLTGVVSLLELLDSPPLFWVLDWHAMWHLSTAPITGLFYSFIIDDCKYLKKKADAEQKKTDAEQKKTV